MKKISALLCALLLLCSAGLPQAYAVATAADMTTVIDVVEEGMTPVTAESLKDGSYPVTVDSSSSMFRIADCVLTVEDGEMRARMTMGGTSYLYVYPGTAEEAVAADESAWIPHEGNADGSYSFTLPLSALDAGVACAAYSKNKELWYDRTLVFRADSLPLGAYADGVLLTAESLGLEDGSYTVEVALEGGSGRARIESPARLTVKDGACTARIVWGSANYDYMRVDGEQYFLVNTEGNSAFEIPVSIFDAPMAVTADTTAMSVPYEIDYTLRFDSASIAPAETEDDKIVGHMDLQYAEQFSVDYYADGSALLTVGGTEKYRVLPAGAELPADLDADVKPLYQPAETVYLASSSAADLFRALGALEQLHLTSTTAANWRLPELREAEERCDILYAGKYSAPDFELLLAEGVDLAVENTMILHAPEILEKIEALGIPALVERSSYESHPLGRVEWIKVYGLLTGRTAEAEAFFDGQAAALAAVEDLEKSGKTAVFFHISPAGVAVVHRPGAYVGKMIELAGGRYVDLGLPEDDSSTSTANMQMEAFFAAAHDADVLIYNGTIDGELDTVEQLLQKSGLLAEFDAVRNGAVWCMERDMFQQSSAAAEVVRELYQVFTGEDTGELRFLHKLT